MGISLEMVDHDKLFNEAGLQPILINDFDLTNTDEFERLNSLIFTTYDKDSLEVVPSCDCGETKDQHNLGVICDNCLTPCLPVTEKPLESVLWIGKPDGISKLVHPHFWLIMRKEFTSSGVSALEWLTNPRYRTPPTANTVIIDRIKKTEINGEPIERGYNYFIENFDEIIEKLVLGKVIKFSTVKARTEFYQFVKENRGLLFSDHIPIPSKVALIKEDTDMGSYADVTHLPMIDAIRTISYISTSELDITHQQLESRLVGVFNKLDEFYTNFYNKALSPKEGWFRKHVYGSRLHFTARAVITSLSDKHNYDDIELPWSLSVQYLKVHLKSKLIRRGFTPDEAIKHINKNTLKYDIVLDEIFNELIAEGPDGRIWTLLHRNPTLTRGSMKPVGIAKVKTNPKDNTIGVSVLILAALNADFDGDQLNLGILLDKESYNRFKRLSPHLYALDLKTPRKLSGYLKLPGPIVAMIANYVHNGKGY